MVNYNFFPLNPVIKSSLISRRLRLLIWFWSPVLWHSYNQVKANELIPGLCSRGSYQKAANGRGKKGIAVRNLLWVFLSNHSGGTLTFACSFGMGQLAFTLSITVRAWAYSLSMFETEQDRGVQWVMLMCQGKLHEGSMQLNVRGHLSHLMKTTGISTVNLSSHILLYIKLYNRLKEWNNSA